MARQAERIIIPQRPHDRFLALDAMRGVAALMVVSGHFARFFGGQHPTAYPIAVDAFFLLSGFVVSHAYDDRFSSGSMTFKSFAFTRARRLLPLMLLGSALGVLAVATSREHHLPLAVLLPSAALNAFALPSPFIPLDVSAFPLNDPFWSLFFELWAANLVFGLLWRHLRGPLLWGVIATSAVGLFVFHQGVDLGGGYSFSTIPMGLSRVGFSFFVGVALSRLHRQHQPKITIPAPLMIAVFAIALVGLHGSSAGLIVQYLCVFLLFPALVFWGASSPHLPARVGFLLGDSSYAVYTLHYPMLILLQTSLNSHPMPHRAAMQVVFLITSGAIALGAAKWDASFQKVLKRGLLRSPLQPPANIALLSR